MEISENISDGVCTVYMKGDTTHVPYEDAKHDIERVLELVLRDDISAMVIDLAEMEHIDSMGFSLFFRLYHEAEKLEKKITIKDAQGSVKKVLKQYDFGKLFDIV